jgi:CheY-like chemotaxis protein
MENKTTILLVDDELHNRNAFYANFRSEYKIILSSSGEEALTILESKHIDIIIADQGLGGITGLEFLERIIDPCPIKIAISAKRDNSDLEIAYLDGKIFGYVDKPWYPNDLEELINKAKEELIVRKSKSVCS